MLGADQVPCFLVAESTDQISREDLIHFDAGNRFRVEGKRGLLGLQPSNGGGSPDVGLRCPVSPEGDIVSCFMYVRIGSVNPLIRGK